MFDINIIKHLYSKDIHVLHKFEETYSSGLTNDDDDEDDKERWTEPAKGKIRNRLYSHYYIDFTISYSKWTFTFR